MSTICGQSSFGYLLWTGYKKCAVVQHIFFTIFVDQHNEEEAQGAEWATGARVCNGRSDVGKVCTPSFAFMMVERVEVQPTPSSTISLC